MTYLAQNYANLVLLIEKAIAVMLPSWIALCFTWMATFLYMERLPRISKVKLNWQDYVTVDKLSDSAVKCRLSTKLGKRSLSLHT